MGFDESYDGDAHAPRPNVVTDDWVQVLPGKVFLLACRPTAWLRGPENHPIVWSVNNEGCANDYAGGIS